MVVIVARGQEAELVGDPPRDPEAEDVAVEADGAVEVGDVQVHVADRGAGIDRRGHGRSVAARRLGDLRGDP